MKKQIVSVLLISLLAACASEKTKESTAAANQAAPAAASAVGASTTPVEEKPVQAIATVIGGNEEEALNNPNSLLFKRSVFYPFDVDTVQPSDKPMVEAHAQYLHDHPNRKVRLEGNADERGSTEYNLALGQRRADGVEKMLLLGGADKSQLDTVSYGEEKPKATGHDEESWAQNRRTDLNYTK